MMRKKLLAIVLLGALALTGCGGKNNGEATLNPMPSSATESQKDNTEDVPAEIPEDGAPEKENTDTGNTAENAESAGNDSGEAETEAYILNFEASTTEGEAWNSDKLGDSKLTMINVWATYCNPCLSEMPDLGELAAEYDSAEFQIVGIVSDVMEGDSKDTIEYAKELIAETKAAYPHLLLNESLYVNLLGPGAVSSVPTTFFVNQENEVLGYVVGAQSKEGWKELIDRLLGETE